MSAIAQTQPFFRAEGDLLIPSPRAAGPWSDDLMNGRSVVAITARAIELEHGDDEFQCARFTIDLMRPTPMEPLSISTRAIRSGGRLRAIEADVHAQGETVARATALLLRRGEQPPTHPWRPPDWEMPDPETLEQLDSPETRNVQLDVRPEIAGRFFADGQRRLWFREQTQLVEGEAWTPFMRAAGVADLSNPLANKAEVLRFINADVNVYLSRLPVGEWLGLEVSDHLSDAGICVGSCSMYDTTGRIGWCDVAGLATAAPPMI